LDFRDKITECETTRYFLMDNIYTLAWYSITSAIAGVIITPLLHNAIPIILSLCNINWKVYTNDDASNYVTRILKLTRKEGRHFGEEKLTREGVYYMGITIGWWWIAKVGFKFSTKYGMDTYNARLLSWGDPIADIVDEDKSELTIMSGPLYNQTTHSIDKKLSVIFALVSESSEGAYYMNIPRVVYPHLISESQLTICSKILTMSMNSYKNKLKRGCICLITGPPGVGKSYIANLLTSGEDVTRISKDIMPYEKGTVFEYNPSKINSDFISAHIKASVSSKKPLFILTNEIDIIVNNIKTKKLRDKIPNASDISELNNIFDNMQYYDNVFWILTSNKSYDELIKISKSTFRPGRIDLYVNMGGGKCHAFPDKFRQLTVEASSNTIIDRIQMTRFTPSKDKDI
jgi:hypothetical protein